jgi:hypothetical protein
MSSLYPIAMTTDKVFILLLVIMLPLTGCLDMTDNAEAEESDEETTVVNNYYNNTTEVSTLPTLYTLHLEVGENATLDFDGTKTMKVETLWSGFSQSNGQMRANIYSFNHIEMSCDNNVTLTGNIYEGNHLPVLAGQNCSIVLTAKTYPTILVMSEANLVSL